MSWELTGTSSTSSVWDGINPSRDTTKYTNWMKTEFQPLTLATPDDTIEQQLENAIRYWNTYSGFKITVMADYSPGQKAVELSPQIKQVVQVYPSSTTSWIWNDHPLWTLLGVTIIDNITGDLIMMSEAFRSYRVYVGTDFRWVFEPSQDPEAKGGKLMAINVPKQTQKLAVVGTKRITKDEDIKNEYILNWILYYAKALVKQIEGNTLRKAGIVNVKNDGDLLVSEGREEMKELQDQLHRDKLWVTLIQRG